MIKYDNILKLNFGKQKNFPNGFSPKFLVWNANTHQLR